VDVDAGLPVGGYSYNRTLIKTQDNKANHAN